MTSTGNLIRVLSIHETVRFTDIRITVLEKYLKYDKINVNEYFNLFPLIRIRVTFSSKLASANSYSDDNDEIEGNEMSILFSGFFGDVSMMSAKRTHITYYNRLRLFSVFISPPNQITHLYYQVSKLGPLVY